MVESTFIPVGVGLILGFFAGLGIGGGSLLILWLTMVVGTPYNVARGMNLLFFLPSAGAAILTHLGSNRVLWKEILPAIASGCAAAGCFSLVANGINLEILKKCFGFLLIITGIRELCWKPK